MSLLALTRAELLVLTQQKRPLIFKEGKRVTFSDVSLSISQQAKTADVLRELGRIFQESRVSLSPISPHSIYVESVSPFTFTALRNVALHSATRSNWLSPPFNRFAFRSIAATHEIDTFKRRASVWELKRSSNLSCEAIENVKYISHDGTEKTLAYMLSRTHTDGIVILRKGEIVYEKYFEGQEAKTPHIQFSVTKSLIGLIVAELIVKGTIDPQRTVGQYIPELAGSAFEDAKVLEVLDMTTGMKYNEEYANPEADIQKHLIAAGYLSTPSEYRFAQTLRAFLPTIKKEGHAHNQAFHYVSANTEVLSWLVEKATALKGEKKTVNELFEEKIWAKIGAEEDAYILKDAVGEASWCGGFTAITRDMARVGQMILNRGRGENEPLLSPETFDFMESRDLRAHYALSIYGQLPSTKGWSYMNQFWWSYNEHRAFTGVGIHGQLLYIDPKAQMVIAKNSSHPTAESPWIDHDCIVALHALAKFLVKEAPI